MDSSNGHEIGGALGVLAALPIVLLLLYPCLCGIVAAVVAGGKGRSGPGYFLLALLFLGPFAIAVAILVEPRTYARPLAAGRRRFICPRCGAENDVPAAESSFDCWRCSERGNVTAGHVIDTQPGPALAAESERSLGDIWNEHLTGETLSRTRYELQQWWKRRNR